MVRNSKVPLGLRWVIKEHAFWLTFFGAISAFNTAHADDGTCKTDPEHFSQRLLAECEDARYKSADAALNAIYRERIHQIGADKEKHEVLVLAERKWIVHRDKECKELIDSSDVIGDTYATANGKCLADKTIERVKALKAGED